MPSRGEWCRLPIVQTKKSVAWQIDFCDGVPWFVDNNTSGMRGDYFVNG